MNEQQLRHVITQMLITEDQYSGASGRLYKAFIEPFVDVAKGVAIAGQSILNSLKLIFDTLTTISPKKLVKARDNYNKRKNVLDREWEPLLKKARDAIQDSDLGLVSFALAPNIFFGMQLVKFGAKAPETVAEYMKKAGWEIPLSSWLEKTPSEKSERERSAARESDKKGVLGALRTLFFGESISYEDKQLVTEANDEETEGLTSNNFKEQLEAYFQETGFDKKLEELATEFINAKRDHANELLESANIQITLLKEFATAKDLAEFEKVLEKAKSNGLEVEEIEKKILELKSSLEKKSQELKTDKKFKDDIAKSAGDEAVSDADIETAAKSASEKAANNSFEELRKSVDESLQSSFEKLKDQIHEELTDDLPEENSPLYKIYTSTEKGKELMAVINTALASISPSSQVKSE